MSESLKSSVFWSVLGQLGYMLIAFGSNILFARFLSPADFGIIAIAMVFVAVFGVIADSGLGGAIVRRESVNDSLIKTVFTFNLLISIVLFTLLQFSSEWISLYYENSDLEYIINALAFILLIDSLRIVPNALLIKNMNFKKRALFKIISILVATFAGIIMLLNEFRIESLIVFSIVNSLVYSLILTIDNKFNISLGFNLSDFREVYKFGFFTTISSLLNSIFDSIYLLLISKHFSVIDNGFYFQAKKIQDVKDTLYKTVILNVFYSYLAKFQFNKVEYKQKKNELLLFTSFLLSLSTSLLIVLSDFLVEIIYGVTWLESAFYLKFFAVAAFFYLIEFLYRNTFKIFDETQKILYIELIKKLVQISTIFIGLFYHRIDLLLIGYIISCFVSYLLSTFTASRLLHSDVNELKIVFKLISVCSMSILVFYISSECFNDKWVSVIFSIFTFSIAFFTLVHLSGIISYSMAKNIIYKLRNK